MAFFAVFVEKIDAFTLNNLILKYIIPGFLIIIYGSKE